MKKYRIKEVNGSFIPERYIKCLFFGFWESYWSILFIKGEWCGTQTQFVFDTYEECAKFIKDRDVIYHNVI